MLEAYFEQFRKNIIGQDRCYDTPYGRQKLIYADWIASGRFYKEIEDILTNDIAPLVANTHTESTYTGCAMTEAYNRAKTIIKTHVGANDKDILISSNSGMTGVVNKFQRILGLKIHEKYRSRIKLEDQEKPIVFISHMEHHSNQTSWLETVAEVEIIRANEDGLMCLNHLDELLEHYSDKKIKIAAITSCSNVTGISTPYHEVAKKMHRQKGYCFVDFACSAPYIDIEMHPNDAESYLDAIYFSPHKFLGGPSSSGILIFNQELYKNRIPDNPGGGTVDWTNPWGEHKYYEAIEAREDGGTPSFIQTMRVALSIQLKEKMGVKNIQSREHYLIDKAWDRMKAIPGLEILAPNNKNRLGVLSFYIKGLHYNLGVKMLSDRYGIQMRGGCSCAGTYGHYLLNVSKDHSASITSKINLGDMSHKPGWIRLSLHPTMTDQELETILQSLEELAENFEEWQSDYQYDIHHNEFYHIDKSEDETEMVNSWFSIGESMVN